MDKTMRVTHNEEHRGYIATLIDRYNDFYSGTEYEIDSAEFHVHHSREGSFLEKIDVRFIEGNVETYTHPMILIWFLRVEIEFAERQVNG